MDLNAVQPGAVVDRYTVEEMVGQGGMALVLRVRHNQLGTTHALKVLTISSPSIRDRLVQEGRVQATLKHANVVAVTDLVTLASGSPGLIMEFVEGPSLEQLLLAGPLSLVQADVLARGILEGVAEAHRLGLVHRDLKPANILLEPGDGTYVAKVADFGLAKVLAGDSLPGRTRTGTTMGTPQYMAPEQVRDAKNVGAAADVFALGAILYELVTGVRAFDSEDMLEIFNAVASGQYTPVLELAPQAHPAMVAAIDAALEIVPHRRPESVEALRDLWVADRGGTPAVPVFPEVSRTVSLATSHSPWSAGPSTMDQSGGMAPPVPPGVESALPATPSSPRPSAVSGESLASQRAVAIAGGGLVLAVGGLGMIALAAAGLAYWLVTAEPAPPEAVDPPVVVEGTPVAAVADGLDPAAEEDTVEAGAIEAGAVEVEPVEPGTVVEDVVEEVVEAVDPAPEAVEEPTPEPTEQDAAAEEAAADDATVDPEVEGKKQLIAHLAQTRDRDSCVQLGKMVRTEEDFEVKRAAWEAVTSMLDQGFGDTIVLQDVVAWQLQHGRARMAGEAAALLGRTATRPELLFPGLDHRAIPVKLATLEAVEQMSQRVPDTRWWFKVKPLTRSTRPRVRDKAKQVLRNL